MPHIVIPVMRMARVKHNLKRLSPRPLRASVMIPFLLMSVFYLSGCFLGCRFGLRSDVPEAIVSILTENSASSGHGFLAVLGCFGFYGILFLLLSTTYLGFLMIPAILGLKGFFVGSLFLTYLQSDSGHAFLRAGISLCLPEFFVLAALLLLGWLCMHLSFRLLCRFRGAPAVGEGSRHERILAVIFVLFLLAAVTETYVVPALIQAIPS